MGMRQVGGSHYASSYQHWDLVLDTGMGYLDGNASKYICRWRSKGGVEDLRKALHYVDKLLEHLGDKFPMDTREFADLAERQATFDALGRFFVANNLSPLERIIVERLATWSGTPDLQEARAAILDLIASAESEPGPVPLTEENHYAERASQTSRDPDGGDTAAEEEYKTGRDRRRF